MSGVTASESTSAPPNTPGASLTQWLQRLRGAEGNPLLLLMLAGAAAVAVMVVLLLWASAPDYRLLYANLSEADGGRIISELEQRNVPYRFSEGGQAVMVPADQVHRLRLQLAEQGLPQAGNVGLSIMDNQAFGISQFAEQVNFQRGLEGELASSIESLSPVARARVHLAMAKPSVFIREREPAKASVVLTLHPGRALGDGQVQAIAHMVSSSVPELATSEVTVVDHNGRLLSRRGDSGTGLDGTRRDYVREVERDYRQRIEDILTPILGRHNVRAQVTAEIDFTQREETAETYRPNQGDNDAAVRSARINATYSGDDTLARGVPGALSNTPPGAAPSPINRGNPDDAGTDEDNTRQLRRDDLINYEVDRNVTHTRHGLGRIERLSVAVVVNYRDALDDAGEATREPLDDAALARIDQLVRQAMGFSLTRGDGLEIVNSPFTDSTGDDAPAWWTSPQWQQVALTLGRYLMVLIAAVLLYRLLLRPLLARQAERAAADASARQRAASVQAQASTRLVEEHDAPDGDDADEQNRLARRRKRRRHAHTYEQNLRDLQDMASEDPLMVAMIIRSWMTQPD